jgi:arylsulfatase A-like enzyme
MERPNVLLIMTDQQRWDGLAAAGNRYIHTPNLDALAESGALFENAFCNNPVCMPSRHSLLSGQYPSAIGSMTNGIEMREDVPCLQHILSPYGYHTANLGKLHFKNHSDRDHREIHPRYGFDTLILSDEPGCYEDAYIKWVRERDPSQVENCRVGTPPAWTGPPIDKKRETTEPYAFEGPEDMTHSAFVAEETITCIRRHHHEPFFAIAGFYAPHTPLNPPQRFVDMYDIDSLPLPKMNEGENKRGLTDREWRTVKAYYYALISHVDDQVGRILTALDEAGVRDNTIVVFTSDHGEHLGDHGLIQKGPPGYDSCIHVPLLVSWPGRIRAGVRRNELVELVDIAPSLLDWCGLQVPPHLQGRSFRPLLEGGDYEPRSSAYMEFRNPFAASWKTVRTHEFKYSAGNNGRELLFDLTNDPHELTNVAEDPACADALGRMRHELLRRWFDVERQYPLKTGQY